MNYTETMLRIMTDKILCLETDRRSS